MAFITGAKKDRMAVSATILPGPHELALRWLEATNTEITAVVETTAASASCSLCGRLSHRIHSRYVRSVAGVPWHGVPFRLRLQARRFFCEEPTCPRAMFTERLPELVAPYARRTTQLAGWLRGGVRRWRHARCCGPLDSPGRE